MKVAELTGSALNWAVAKCKLIQHLTSLGKTPNYEQCDSIALSKTRLGVGYSTNWALGGPIIERAKINVVHLDETLPDAMAPHVACCGANIDGIYQEYGPTPLIAAMRCYVASKLGDEIEIPEELL